MDAKRSVFIEMHHRIEGYNGSTIRGATVWDRQTKTYLAVYPFGYHTQTRKTLKAIKQTNGR